MNGNAFSCMFYMWGVKTLLDFPMGPHNQAMWCFHYRNLPFVPSIALVPTFGVSWKWEICCMFVVFVINQDHFRFPFHWISSSFFLCIMYRWGNSLSHPIFRNEAFNCKSSTFLPSSYHVPLMPNIVGRCIKCIWVFGSEPSLYSYNKALLST